MRALRTVGMLMKDGSSARKNNLRTQKQRRGGESTPTTRKDDMGVLHQLPHVRSAYRRKRGAPLHSTSTVGEREMVNYRACRLVQNPS